MSNWRSEHLLWLLDHSHVVDLVRPPERYKKPYKIDHDVCLGFYVAVLIAEFNLPALSLPAATDGPRPERHDRCDSFSPAHRKAIAPGKCFAFTTNVA